MKNDTKLLKEKQLNVTFSSEDWKRLENLENYGIAKRKFARIAILDALARNERLFGGRDAA